MAGVLRPSRGQVRGLPRSIGYLPSAELRLSTTAYLRHLAAVRGLPRGRGTDYARSVAVGVLFARPLLRKIGWPAPSWSC